MAVASLPWWDDTMPWIATSAGSASKSLHDLLVDGTGQAFAATEAIEASYAAGVTDVFIEPAVLTDENGQGIGHHCRRRYRHLFQLPHRPLPADSRALPRDFADHDMPYHTAALCHHDRYDHSFKGVEVIFEK